MKRKKFPWANTPFKDNRLPIKSFLILIITLSYPTLHAQVNRDIKSNSLGMQLGVSVRCLIEFGFGKDATKPVLFHLGINSGVSSNFAVSEVHPSLNVEVQLYNGGIGSRRPGDTTNRKPKLTLDCIVALTVTTGLKNLFIEGKEQIAADRNIPLYYFADFSYPSLQNPYNSSLSFGTNLVFTNDPKKEKQRLGFINIHVDRFQISYYNDGAWGPTELGDGADRYFTGGGVISYHGKSYTELNLVEVSFHKFTGYTQNAFELSNKLDLSFVSYRQPEQKYYNKSLWTVNLANPVKGYGINLCQYNNVSNDAQHLIHWSVFNAYHTSPYEDFIAISGQYYYGQSNIGLR